MKTIREVTLEILTELGKEHGFADSEDKARKAVLMGDITYAASMPEDKDVGSWVIPDEILPAFKQFAKNYFETNMNWNEL